MKPRVAERSANGHQAWDTRVEILGNVVTGSILRFQGDWGVMCQTPRGAQSRKWRTVDFWEGGRCLIPAYVLVEVLKPEIQKKRKRKGRKR